MGDLKQEIGAGLRWDNKKDPADSAANVNMEQNDKRVEYLKTGAKVGIRQGNKIVGDLEVGAKAGTK